MKTNEKLQLRVFESIYRDATSGGFVAEIRGLLNLDTGLHEWIRIGIFGTREAAEKAIVKTREHEVGKD